jgi:hypothetical protein
MSEQPDPEGNAQIKLLFKLDYYVIISLIVAVLEIAIKIFKTIPHFTANISIFAYSIYITNKWKKD